MKSKLSRSQATKLLHFGTELADLIVLDQWLRSLQTDALDTKLSAYLLSYTAGNIIMGPFAALQGHLATRKEDKNPPCF